MSLRFTPLQPGDLAAIQAQPSQRVCLGIDCGGTIDYEEALALCGQPAAWCARRESDGTVLACFGINETFPGAQGVCWALLAEGIGADHLQLTRFIISEVIEASSLTRIELLAKCCDIEPALDEVPGMGRDAQLTVVTSPALRTPEVRWAMTLGLTPAYVMRKAGFAAETYLVLERIA